ncbi:hypothetical protein [Streptomyces sp. AC495_CC817]|uniref:hypothetical protein n=1 Tax=Streptomyces sp. AC495_CC817 TaxID=2823900 RepID=UPI001C26D069|nr:hypothetical protein [Streptomyces sp. AC495_CC817]
MTTDEWNAFALGLEQALTNQDARITEQAAKITEQAAKITEQAAKIAALEAWVCRRPGDPIPQPFIDQIRAEAIASVTPPVDPEPQPEESAP